MCFLSFSHLIIGNPTFVTSVVGCWGFLTRANPQETSGPHYSLELPLILQLVQLSQVLVAGHSLNTITSSSWVIL